MKLKNQNLLTLLMLAFLLASCGKRTETKAVLIESGVQAFYTYSVALEAVDTNYLAPALQSYAHAKIGNDWLLFAGRTNENENLGGLHNLNTNDYSLKSFPAKSFNSFIYAFNPETGTKAFLDFWTLLGTIQTMAKGENGESEVVKATCLKVANLLEEYGTVFICTNPQAVQSGEYLYVVGGYGPPAGQKATAKNYTTSDAIAKINVPLLMRLVNNDWNLSALEWTDLFKFGNNSTLKATGGELKVIDKQFYLAAGHDFGPGQVYLNAVYEFGFSANVSTLELTATVTDTISDMSSSVLRDNPKLADSTSIFRRRDLPIVPAVYLDKNNAIASNFALMAGVFKYGEKVYAAWNDAIYITPNGTTKFTVDAKHNQNNSNVYSCPDFVIYDTQSQDLHTFLPGGIGNGKLDKFLSGFSNTLGYSKYNVSTKVSAFDTISNIFPSTKFYGAEAAFMPNSNAKYLTINNMETDVIDGDSTFSGTEPVHIGYIYGGIESYEESPSTYGSGKSGASNKLWKVMVSRFQIADEKLE
ncbi:hypothetical protein [Lacinutrix jangbogonensis]|uniref:hypothetical protein n=1 Tax=Lacinutrix jangbogonensis TaxID=1469557 RepID=UPI00053E2F5B|nr:hypothetical protein [Lacinutrix jangbogonensis]